MDTTTGLLTHIARLITSSGGALTLALLVAAILLAGMALAGLIPVSAPEPVLVAPFRW